MASDSLNAKLNAKLREKLLEKTGKWKSMKIRILAFVNTQSDSYIPKTIYTLVSDFQIAVEPQTTIKQIKDLSMKQFTTLHYYQMSFEFWNKTPSDSTTIQNIIDQLPYFTVVKCLHLHITIPNEMFIAMYKTFSDMGMNEEKALAATKSFMETVHNEETDHEYDIDMRLEKCRLRLEKYGIKITNPNPCPTVCE